MSVMRVAPLLRRLASEWGPGIFFAALAYVSIVAYMPGTLIYNHRVAGYMASATVLLLFAVSLQGTRWRVPRDLAWLGAGTLLALLVATVRAPDPGRAMWQLQLYLAVPALGVALYLLHRDGRYGDARSYLLLIPVVHMVILAMALMHLTWLGQEGRPGPLNVPYFGNIRHFAYHGYLAAACAGGLFLVDRRFGVSALLMSTAALFGIVLLGARGALLAWVSFVLVVGLLTREKWRWALYLAATLLLALGITAVVASFAPWPDHSLFARIESGVGGEMTSSSLRGVVWAYAAGEILQSPWFGYGPDGFVAIRCCGWHNVQPHNVVLQLLLEFGVVGTVGLMALTWRLLRGFGAVTQWHARLRHDAQAQGLFAVLVGMLVFSLVDGTLYHAVPLLHAAALAGLLFAVMARPEQP